MDWDALETAVAGCVKCRLCEGRNKTVFGVGDRKAKWLFIGEGPGRNEDLQGLPFVGPAGKLLDRVCEAAGGDTICNGADDDASGVVAVLEIARELARGPRPRRTVIIALTLGLSVSNGQRMVNHGFGRLRDATATIAVVPAPGVPRADSPALVGVAA